MMSNQEVLNAMYQEGRRKALDLQSRAAGLTGTELNAETDIIPEFQIARKTQNMLLRPVGFVCKSSAGRVVRLLQNYNSDIYTAEPEELPAQWAFVWSDDPQQAKPFVALSTSPYMMGNCCLESNGVYRSAIDNNVWSPSTYPKGWNLVEST